MKKTFFLFTLVISFIFTGCTEHLATRYFDKSSLYSSALQYTKKADIVYEDEVKVMMNVTYLNAVNKMWDDEFENFIIGIYIVDNTKQEIDNSLEDLSFFLSLNGRNYVSLEKLTPEHVMYNNLPLMNQWASYYVVKFDQDENDKGTLKANYYDTSDFNNSEEIKFTNNDILTLKLNHTTYGETSLSFELR
ncbi:hypothetical protein [Candidatus Marinarcus aquaticus]|uniref:Uncharacterized protein n=1 Tax=Candidatus Marinarcus aquaticus TaxID=2044504 RepID=A0A4Q0XS58_9BACT|nr:hypothetical protein [Candidatus Marinarcus aquaticus]RXJ60102.1 hypothetical protein CRV04_03620 [Candidatus Marinarcus aquaticus]